MSVKKKSCDLTGEIFTQPDMRLTLWRCLWIVLFWFVYSAGSLLAGYYAYCWFSQSSISKLVPQDYYLSDSHYIYKKRPLPVLEESVHEVSDTEQPKFSVDPAYNSDFNDRVKQVISEINLQ